MMDMSQPRKIGDFGNQIMLAPYEATADGLAPTATMFGLPQSQMVAWGGFEDEEGNSYCICRELPGYITGGGWVMSNAGRNGMLMLPQSADLWMGGLAIDTEGDRIQWTSADKYRGATPALDIAFDSGRAYYREADLVELEAEPAAIGYQFYEPTNGQGTTNQVLSAKGTIAGRKVSGWLGFNAHFQRPGLNYRISPMVRGGQMLMWLDVGNVFEDGSWEQGPIIVGRDGFTAIWITNDKGEMTFSQDVHAEFDLGDDGFATEMRFSYHDARTGDLMKWVWRPKPGSNMTQLPSLAPHLKYKRSAEGSCVRVGENRKLLHTSAWPELQVDERIEAFLAEQAAHGRRV